MEMEIIFKGTERNAGHNKAILQEQTSRDILVLFKNSQIDIPWDEYFPYTVLGGFLFASFYSYRN